MSLRAPALLTLALLVVLGGCLGRERRGGSDDDAVDPGGSVQDDDGLIGNGSQDPAPVDDPPPDDPADPADPADPGDPEDPADPGPVTERGAYPTGPYGVWNGDTMRNYSFLTGTGTIDLQEVRRDASHDILLLYLGSASCAYCGVESPELNTIYAANESRGLEIFGVLSDDAQGPPTGASADRYFRDEHGAEYPYAANEWADGTLMTDLYPDGNVALPMNFVIDLETMEILERMDGYPSEGGLQPLVEAYLGG